MGYYITKPNSLTGETMYYEGNRRWSDQPNNKKIYAFDVEVSGKIVNIDGKNGGWTGAQIVSE